MKNLFQAVQFNRLKSNKFDLTHDVKLSFAMGEIIPTCVLDVIPGDVFRIKVSNMLRFAPLISPVMHRVKVKTNYFFVPNRILWSEWEDWITGKTDVEPPYVDLGSLVAPVQVGSIADYMGVPTGEYEEPVKCTLFPFAALRHIWNEYFRDQNLQSELFVDLVPGDNTATNWGNDFSFAGPLRRAWGHDYLTSCLPTPQSGSASVQIPLTIQDNIPVDYQTGGNQVWVDPDTGVAVGPGAVGSSIVSEPTVGGVDAGLDPNGTLTVDVQSDATDINTLRRAFRLQEFLERTIRGGNRYFEQLRAHFDVKSPDSRLQRPEYIGGYTQNMVISEVLATAQSNNDGSTAEIAVGSMGGHGISVGSGDTFSYRAVEHGYIIGVISVIPDTAYQDGLHRHFSRFDRFDYAWPSFANIGEQAVLQKEVRARVEAGTDPNRVFGYQSRYAEYKHANSRVAGAMRDTLSFWHLGRIFTGTADPELNAQFIRCQPDPRIFAVTEAESDHIFAHVLNQVTAIRKLPKFGIPTI